MEIFRESILGITISAINMEQALSRIDTWVADDASHYICVVPAHSIMDGVDDHQFQAVLNASDLNTPDGMPLVWLLKSRGHKHVQRVYGPDLMLAALERSLERGYRHFFYGGEAGVAEQLACRMREEFPGIEIVGVHTPPFRPLTEQESQQLVAEIHETDPDILWVGISSPKQEFWMRDYKDLLNAPVLIGVGAAFDFLSGRKPQAPSWVQRNGLEWLYRWIQEPGRLWPRYRKYPRFVWMVLMEQLGLKTYN